MLRHGCGISAGRINKLGQNTSFTLTLVAHGHKSVAGNLQIDPPLMGKAAWAGRRMAYTLAAPAPYGTSYQVQLQGAQDRFTGQTRAADPAWSLPES